MKGNFTKKDVLLLVEKETRKNIALCALINADDKIALFKRADDEETNPNKWGLVGGGVESSDKSNEAGLAREIKEELGLSLNNFTFVREFKYDDAYIHVYCKRVKDIDPTLNDEHSDWGWFSIDDLPSPGFSNTKENFEGALECLNKPESVNESVVDAIDFVKFDIPLFIRLIEYAREDAKTDMDLHDLTQRAIELTKEKGTLDMNDYNTLVGVKGQKNELSELDLEEDYPSSWNAEEFAKLGSFKNRLSYVNKHLGRTYGGGSSRKAYIIDEYHVLKLAFNRKGIAQNLAEINNFENFDSFDVDVVAKINNYDKRGLWLEMERAKKINEAEFKRITGFPFDGFIRFMLLYFGQQQAHGMPRSTMVMYRKQSEQPEVKAWMESFEEHYLEGWENEENFGYKVMYNLLSNFDGMLNINDLGLIQNWGKVVRDGEEQVVLIDYGLDMDVSSSHYGMKEQIKKK